MASNLDQADLDLLLQAPNQWPEYNNYQPLDQSRKEIRVLKIWHEDQRKQIHASVMQQSLEAESEYDALSYYWGPPDQQKSIYVDGQPILIRESLYSFLDALCHHKQDLPVWLDSICINQRDVKERNSQVAMMGEIYRNATCVKAWIGEPDADLKYLFAYLQNRSHRKFLDSEHFTEAVERAKRSLEQILTRPYWRRLWIIQEIGLAKRAVILAGEKSVDLEELTNIAVHELHLVGTFLDRISEFQDLRSMRESTKHGRLNNAVHRSFTTPDELDDHWLSSETILGRMSDFGKHLCQNPRDKIFGLLSLTTDENPIKVDYGKSITELMSQLLHALMQRRALITGYSGPLSYALPLVRLDDMLYFTRAAAEFSSFGINLTDLEQPTGYELCCRVESIDAQVYGLLTPGFYPSLGNRGLCKFRRWKRTKSPAHKDQSELPHSRSKLLYDPIVSNDDTSFYQASYQRTSNDRICHYLGDHEPDPLRCRFFKICPTDSDDDAPYEWYAQGSFELFPAALLVEFKDNGPRVAGISAYSNWWDKVIKSDSTNASEVLYGMTLVDALAVLLLEGEVQVCSRITFDEPKRCDDAKMELRLHCSRLSSMIMLIVNSKGLSETNIMEYLRAWRATHPQLCLCDCECEEAKHLEISNLVRKANIDDIRKQLKRDTLLAQTELGLRRDKQERQERLKMQRHQQEHLEITTWYNQRQR